MNTTNLDSNNPTIERQVGRLLPIVELLRDPQATLSEVRRIQEVLRRRLAAQQAERTTKQLELLVEQIACALRVEVERPEEPRTPAASRLPTTDQAMDG